MKLLIRKSPKDKKKTKNKKGYETIIHKRIAKDIKCCSTSPAIRETNSSTYTQH